MKKHVRLVSDFRRNALIMAAAATLGLTGCSSAPQEEEWSTTTADERAQRGVLTELQEVKPDEWRIVNERSVPGDQAAAIMHHYDGTTDTLRGRALEEGIQQHQATYGTNHGGFGMWNVLMWSGLGYMMGRNSAPNSRFYANPTAYQRSSSTYRQTAPRAGRTGFFRSSRGYSA